jgi:hypothetical protein
VGLDHVQAIIHHPYFDAVYHPFIYGKGLLTLLLNPKRAIEGD